MIPTELDPVEAMKLEGRRVTVLGAGASGLAAARLLARRGARVFLSERADLSEEVRQELDDLGVAYEAGGHTARAWREADWVIPSPGVPPSNPVLRAARREGIPVLGELELAYRFCPSSRIIAVTGTNGKTTTTRLICAMLRAAGHHAVAAGNIGLPWTAALGAIRAQTWVVLEVSSFQLETVERFRPHIAVLVNFSPDHLDRHGTLEAYWQAKCRLLINQGPADHALHPADVRLPDGVRAQKHRIEPLPDEGQWAGLPRHQRENLSFARAAARLADPACDLAQVPWKDLLGGPHRLEFVAQVEGVRFYNDSKATNPAATQAALEALAGRDRGPITLILGGRDKKLDFDPLARSIASHPDVSRVLLVGEAAPRIGRALARAGFELERTQTVFDLEEAVHKAVRQGPGLCLLAPACASFDAFADYRERGRAFRRAVQDLIPSSSPSPSQAPAQRPRI